MDSWTAQAQRSPAVWFRVVTWLAVFLSPSAYFLSLAFWSRLQLPIPPMGVFVFLFGLIPIVALLVCGSMVWRKKLAVGWRVGQLVLTMLGMAIQVGVLLVIIRAVLVATISYGQ